MNRINSLFQWGFFILVTVMAGIRAVPGYDDWPEIVCVMLLFTGFLAWAFISYVYAWYRVVSRFVNAQAKPDVEVLPPLRHSLAPPVSKSARLEPPAYWPDSE